MRECIDIGEYVVLVVHQNIRGRGIAAAGKRTAAFSFRLVTIDPSPAQSVAQNVDVLGAERCQGCNHFLGRFIKANVSLDFWDKWNVSIVGVELIEIEDTTSQFIVTNQRRNAFSHRTNQSFVDRDRHIVCKQGSLQSTGIIAGSRSKDIRFYRIRKRGRECELVILEFVIELSKGALSDSTISFQ